MDLNRFAALAGALAAAQRAYLLDQTPNNLARVRDAIARLTDLTSPATERYVRINRYPE